MAHLHIITLSLVYDYTVMIVAYFLIDWHIKNGIFFTEKQKHEALRL